jgi:hypothetical protein
MPRALPVLVLIAVLAGCSSLPDAGTPEPSEHALSVTVSNEHDVAYLVRMTAVPAGAEGLEVTYENGSTHRFDVASFDALPETALRNATAVATGEPGERSREFTVGADEGFGTTVEDVPANATVVYFVLAEDGSATTRGAGVVRCSPDTATTELALRIRPDGSLHSSVTCSDEPLDG